MIDLHTHLLPGVDDGSRSEEASRAVLERFAAEGVTMVACTPHLRASEADHAPVEAHRALRESLQRAVAGGPRLIGGWEIMLDEPGTDLARPELGLGGARAVLVEFPRGGVPVRATDELHRLVRLGVRPIVAHPDRYAGCTLEQVRAWRQVGALIQSDAMALGGRGRGSALGQALLANGFIDLLASDNHGDRRSMAASVQWLAAHGGEEQLPLLTQLNPQRLLTNQDPLPVPPLRPSVARRLQQWLGRWRRRR